MTLIDFFKSLLEATAEPVLPVKMARDGSHLDYQRRVWVQRKLRSLGFNTATRDYADFVPATIRAVELFQAQQRLGVDGIVGPKTWAALVEAKPVVQPQKPKSQPRKVPWVEELGRVMGWHETHDYNRLSKWLRSDGAYLGDPRKFPWCGDAAQTSIKRTLPNEPWPGRVGKNPYLARNWQDFGKKWKMALGVMVPMWRGSRSGTAGHIGALIGYDPRRKMMRIRGGNQSNRVSDVWIEERRALDFRAPVTYKYDLPPVPIMNSRGQVISTNEA
jgi:hypothetical protein